MKALLRKIRSFVCKQIYWAVDPGVPIEGKLYGGEGMFLYNAAKSLRRDGVILEIGAYSGLSTYFLTKGSAWSGASVYSIDPFNTKFSEQAETSAPGDWGCSYNERKPSKAEVERLLKSHHLNRFELIEGFSYDVVKAWDKPIDILFIDGSHKYELVKGDLLDWSKFLKSGGLLILHDSNLKCNNIGWDGPSRVAEEMIVGDSAKWRSVRRLMSITAAVKI